MEDIDKIVEKQKLKNRLCHIFYGLMRDHITSGVMEEIIQDFELIFNGCDNVPDVEYSNFYLINHCEDIVERILGSLKSEIRNRKIARK